MQKLIKIAVSLIIDFLQLLMCIVIAAVIGAVIFPAYDDSAGAFAFLSLICFSIYLLLSNVLYRGFSSFILKTRFVSARYRKIKVLISNIILYGSLIGFVLFYSKDSLLFYGIFSSLYFIEVFSCLIPRIGTRMSFYLLKIDWLVEDRVEKNIKKGVDKIL